MDTQMLLAVEMQDDVLLPSPCASSARKSGLSKISSTKASSSSCKKNLVKNNSMCELFAGFLPFYIVAL
jgi:hypothetical protein